jgi:hypothetical protein
LTILNFGDASDFAWLTRRPMRPPINSAEHDARDFDAAARYHDANVALPYMQGSLSATSDEINWVLTSWKGAIP